MVAKIDAREGRLDFDFRAGNELDIELTFEPSGWLSGKTFTSDLGGDALTVLPPDGDVLGIHVSAALSDRDLGVAVRWNLYEAGGNLLISGLWTPSTAGTAASSVTSAVTIGGGAATATVNVLGGVGHVIDGGDWNNDDDDFYDGGDW